MNIIVTGSKSGLGAAIYSALTRTEGNSVFHYDLKDGMDVRNPKTNRFQGKRIDVLINCAGVNHIDWLENFSESDWDTIMSVNVKGIFAMTKALLPWLKESKGTVLNIVSNASHMPMTCSAAYNASKGAAHILTLQLARELTRKHGITVFGISPNKLVGTRMSRHIEDAVVRTRGWTEEQAKSYQLASLLSGEETPPAAVADFIAYLLSSKDRHKYLTGTVIPYGA